MGSLGSTASKEGIPGSFHKKEVNLESAKASILPRFSRLSSPINETDT